jgi:predicted enzyme related to lactoylglutathione lyase
MPGVIHFELVSNDPEKTKTFYEEVFGWSVDKWQGPMEYWFLVTGDAKEKGIDGAFGRRQSPEDVVADTIGVSDIDERIRLIEENGGKIISPKHPIPGVGWVAYFTDTEGNTWGMMQDDPKAK